MRKTANAIPVAEEVMRYAMVLVSATHPDSDCSTEAAKKYIRLGASPRAGQALISAAKVKGNDLQSARTQCVSVQDFKDGAETDVRVGVRSKVADPEAGRIEPAKRTARRGISILSPRIQYIPVFDISAVFVQYPIPFVALGRAAF